MAGPQFVYVPTLAIRPSEMNGLEQLPALSKDRMRPVFLLAPWATAKLLDKAVKRAEKAFSDRTYILDLDRDYDNSKPQTDSQRELQRLFDSSNCYENWWSFVSGYQNVQPCLQLRGQTRESIRHQIRSAQNLQREFCVRVELQRAPENLEDVVAELNAIGSADFAILIDGGWTQDPLLLSSKFLGLINDLFEAIDASVPIIVSSTSMLSDFQDVNSLKEVPIGGRALVQQIASNTNRRNIVYGDWGSTRPREPASHRQRPLDRIDYPTPNAWVIARNKDAQWTYKEAAEAIVHRSKMWNGNLNIWGENMIVQTIANPIFGINTPQKNVASRVNIHLHLQAFYGEPDFEKLDFDEDWED